MSYLSDYQSDFVLPGYRERVASSVDVFVLVGSGRSTAASHSFVARLSANSEGGMLVVPRLYAVGQDTEYERPQP